ncbi:MAG TPA: multiple monosaccharide ABC transporter permease [Candidatus Limnocylindria bacterium]|nr:multiple monosaccharide ABC transporter permease [Candidatus Limnocylindria bacterium]
MGKLKAGFSRNIKQFVMLIMLVIIIVFFQLLTKGTLLKPMNVFNLINQNAYVVVLAVGMLVCILTGGNIDLSVGSVVAFVGACAGTFMISWKWDPYLSALLCMLIGMVIGAWHGFWIAYAHIPAFIVTLSGQLIFRGLTLILLKGLTLSPFPSAFMGLSTGAIPNLLGGLLPDTRLRNVTSLVIGILLAVGVIISQFKIRADRKRKGYTYDGILAVTLRSGIIAAAIVYFFYILANYTGAPVVLISVGIVLMVYTYITSKTVMGRHLYAVGGNEKAARLSGVKTDKIKFLAYVNMSFLAAVAGLIFSARLNSSSPQAGTGFELDAIAACYIGGASAYGGIGTVGGALIGALIMGVLNNGMSIQGISIDVQQVVKGLVLLAAVAFDVISKQKVSLPFLSRFSRWTARVTPGEKVA